MKFKFLLTTAAISVMGLSSIASADTIQNQPLDRPLSFSELDVNNDGLYSRSELGGELFHVFDRDSNQVIDNQEWSIRSTYTLLPIEQETYEQADLDHDGLSDVTSYRQETVFIESGLIPFEEVRDGLGAEEFTSIDYQKLDQNGDNLIQLEEWENVYMVSLAPQSSQEARYNN